MFYGIIDFCLNSMNGPFYTMPAHILDCDGHWARLLPCTSLYIAFVGIKTPFITFSMVQPLLLFRTVSSAGAAAAGLVDRHLPGHGSALCALELVLSLAAVPAVLSYAFSILYHTKFRRSISTIGRIVQAVSFLVMSHVFSSSFSLYAINFLCCRLLMFCIVQRYFRYSKAFLSGTLAFIGSYYFLKLAPGVGILRPLLPPGYCFDFVLWREDASMGALAVSYSALTILFLASYASQNALTRRARGKGILGQWEAGAAATRR